ncbi:MAG: hypothetical protein RBR86_03570 [Pseudobdellovibrionaceae bacterium]|jgi:hypothetical protein|nr:hypothetical protein [Pseudobdellovibrionaceae bacterium]
MTNDTSISPLEGPFSKDQLNLIRKFNREERFIGRLVKLAVERQEPLSFHLSKLFELVQINVAHTRVTGNRYYGEGDEKDHLTKIASVVSTSCYYAHLDKSVDPENPASKTTTQHTRNNKASIAAFKRMTRITNELSFTFT